MADQHELGGWVKLYRSLLDHPVWSHHNAARTLTWIFMRVNWKVGYYKGNPVPRGSLITGRHAGSEAVGLSPSTFQRALDKLVELGCITIKADNQKTIVTLCNYERYQGDEQSERTADGQRMDSERTADGQRMDTIEEGKKGSTEEPKKNTPAAAPPGDSSDKPAKPKPTKPPAFDPLAIAIPPSLDTPLFRQAWAKWIAYRKEIGKPLRQTGTAETLEKFVQLGQSAAIAMIEQSILSGWQGLFPSSSRAPQNSTSLNHRIASKIIQPVTYDPDNQKRLSGF